MLTLEEAWRENLKSHGVKLPREGSISRDTLEVLYAHMAEFISKLDINKSIGYDGPDNQMQRGLKRDGWHVISDANRPVKYKLVDLNVKPGWNPGKRKEQFFKGWENIKEAYDCRCATCGSKEGEPSFKDRTVITKLEKGHMDPSKQLTDINCIPQCTICNKAFRDWWIFDSTGRVIEKNYESARWNKNDII